MTSTAGATYTDAITLSRLVLPRRVRLSSFQLTCSSAEEGISVRRISSPGRTSLAGTALVASSSEPLCQDSCCDRKLKHLLSDPASSLRNHPMYLRIHLAVFHISHIRDQHQTEGFSEDVTGILLSATRASICACRFMSGTSLVAYEAGLRYYRVAPEGVSFTLTTPRKRVSPQQLLKPFFVSFPHNKTLYPALLRRYLKATRNLRPLFPSSKTFILMLY